MAIGDVSRGTQPAVTPVGQSHDSGKAVIVPSEANAGGAEVYIGLRIDSGERHCSTAYYAGYQYSSPGGRRLAELLCTRLSTSLEVPDGGSHGMSLPLLRETRMPAVIIEISPATVVVERARTRFTGKRQWSPQPALSTIPAASAQPWSERGPLAVGVGLDE